MAKGKTESGCSRPPVSTESEAITVLELTESEEIQAVAESVDSVSRETKDRRLNWHQEVNEGLEWLHNRAWPLGGLAIFLAVLYLYSYTIHSNVSLSITSATVIAALPMMLALVIFVEFILVGMILMPTVVLFTPIKKDGPVLISLLNSWGKKRENLNEVSAHSLFWPWMFALAVITILFLAIGGFFTEVFTRYSPWSAPISIVLSVALFTLIFIWVTGKVKNGIRIKEISFDYWFVTFITGLLQLLLVITAIRISTQMAEASPETSNFYLMSAYTIVIVAMVGVVQLVGAILFLRTKEHKSPVRQSALIATFIVIGMSLFPPVSGSLAAYAFQITASGGRTCTVLSWASEPSPIIAKLSDAAKDLESKPLHVLLSDNDVYQVRLKESHTDDIYL